MKNIKSTQSGFGHVEILIVIVIIAVIGFTALRVIGANNDNSNNQASISDQEDQPAVDELPSDLSTIKPLAEIQELAKTDAADSNVLGIGLEVQDGRIVYIVHLTSGQVLVYDAITGEAVRLTDDKIKDGEAIPVDFIAGISIQQAIDIAKQKRPDSKLKKVEIEVEEGIVVYSVRFSDDSRVDINAADGTIQRLKDEAGTDIIKVDDDDRDNSVDSDDENERNVSDDSDDEEDNDDENRNDSDDSDDDDDDEEVDNSGSGSSNSGSGSN